MLVDPHLRGVFRGRLDAFERTIAARLADELGVQRGDGEVRAFSAGVAGLLLAIADRASSTPRAPTRAATSTTDLAFLRVALDALRERSAG